MIEYVALRVAAVAPDTALELANAIPEPAFLDDLPGSCERPTRVRCLWKLAQVTAESDAETGRRFMEQVEGRGTKFDSFICGVALAVSLFRRSVPEAIEVLRSVHSMIEDEQERAVSGFLFVKWLLWHIPDIKLEESLEVLRSLSGFTPIRGWQYSLCDIFDMKFTEQPAFWIEAAKDLTDGWSKDFIAWRLTSLGHLPPPQLKLIEDPMIRDIMRADACIEGAQRQTNAALVSGCQIETLSGNCRAIAGVIGLLIKQNPVRAQQVVHCFLESDQLAQDLHGLSGALEVLTAIIDTTWEARRSVLTWCLDTMNVLRPELDRPTAAAMVGNVLRAGLIKRPRSDKPVFFKGILGDLQKEPDRLATAEILIQELAVEECMELAKRRQEFDIGIVASASNENAEDLLLAESKVGLLLLLSGRVRPVSEEVAGELVLEAAGLCTQIPDRVNRENHASEVLEWAMRLRPTLFWGAYDLCPVNAVRITGAIMDVLAEQRECNDLRDTYLRLELERYLDASDEEGSESISFAVKRLAMLASKGFQKRHARELVLYPPSSVWLQDLSQFVSTYVSRFRDDRVTLSYLHTDFAWIIAELNWEVFMKIARREDVGAICVGDMNLDQLRKALTQANMPPRRLLDDLKYIAVMESPIYRCKKGLGRFTMALVAALAAYYPEGCLRTLRRVPKQTRCRFALNALGMFSSCTKWSRQRILALFQLFEESEIPDDVVQAKASFLEWLSASQDVGTALWTRVYEQACADTNPVVVAKVAKHLSRWKTELGSRLLDRAIQGCEESPDVSDALAVLELHKDIDITVRRRILNHLAGREATRTKHLLEKVAFLQAGVDPKGALRTLSRAEEGELDPNKLIAAVAEHVPVSNDLELEDWCKRVEAVESLKEELKQRFRERVLWRCIRGGMVVATHSIRKVSDFHDRLRLLVQFADSAGCAEKRDLLEEVRHQLETTNAPKLASGLYVSLGNAFLPLDKGQALRCYTAALDEAMRADNGIAFQDTIVDVAKVCFTAPSDVAFDLAGYAMEIVERFPYDRSPFITPGNCRFDCLMICAVAMKTCGHPRLTATLIAAADEWRNAAPSAKHTPSLLWPHMLVQLGGTTHSRKAEDFLAAAIQDWHSDSHAQLADLAAAQLSTSYETKNEPLREFGIFQQKLNGIREKLLRQVLPHCSANGSMVAHLALAVTLYEKGDSRAKDHIRSAAALTKAADSKLSTIGDIRRTIWLAWGVIGDEEDFAEAAHELAHTAGRIDAYASRLLQGTLNKLDNRKPFLRALIEGLWAVEDHVMPV
jgi:hypothetical protein